MNLKPYVQEEIVAVDHATPIQYLRAGQLNWG